MNSRKLPNGCNVSFALADAARLPLGDNSVDLVVGSPPYCDARTYGINAQRDCAAWVDWMLSVTREACRVSRGLVIWVCAGVTRDWQYWPACEGLLWEWWKSGGSCWRPIYWHRSGIPGSGGRQWFRADVEYCLAFKRERGPIPWADNTAMGHPPKYPPGGACSYRLASGERVRQRPIGPRGLSPTGHTDRARTHTSPALALVNPGNLFSTGTGGRGHLGDLEAHDNEAPYPERVAEFFIRSVCRPGGVVLDPFSGSGTTAITAGYHGRNGIGFDLRQSQIDLALRRLDRRIAEGRAVKPIEPQTQEGAAA